MTLGGNGTVPYIGPILLLLLGVYRIFSVIRNRNILNSQKTNGLIFSIRVLGIIAMTLGAVVAIVYPFINTIALAIFGKPGDSGVAFYVVRFYFAMAKGLAPLGIILFEASRLIMFETESVAKV